MGNVEISVIIPVYNVEPYLANCLNSVINQTFKNIEIICIDDGSTDNSGAICDAYAQNDNRIKVVHQNNQGLSVARNVGLDLANGKYISFIDSDDYVHPKFLEILCGLCEDNQCLISMCGLIKTNSLYLQQKDISTYNKHIFHSRNVVLYMLSDIDIEFVVVWNKLYRKECFKDLRFPIGKIHEDEFLTHKILLECSSIAYTDEKLYYYVQHSNSIMGKGFNRKFLDSIEARIERKNFFLNEKMLYEKLYMQSLVALYNSLGYCKSKFVELYSDDWNTIKFLEAKKQDVAEEIEQLNLDKDKCIDELNNQNSVLIEEKDKLCQRIVWLEECVQTLESNINLLSFEKAQLRESINILENTFSFKIGRFITFIHRKLCGGIRCYRENGLAYTLKRCKEKFLGIFDDFI